MRNDQTASSRGVHPHPAEPDVAGADQPVDAEPDQQQCGRPLQQLERDDQPHESRRQDRRRDGRGVAQCQRSQRAPDGAAALALEPQGHREEPAHGGVDAMAGAEREEGEQESQSFIITLLA